METLIKSRLFWGNLVKYLQISHFLFQKLPVTLNGNELAVYFRNICQKRQIKKVVVKVIKKGFEGTFTRSDEP